MRLKLLTNLNTLLLVAVCLALGATLWWSQQALERPFLLMERYLSLSQQFQNNVARNIEDYLASGDALRLSDANSALDSLKSELGPLPPALADTLRPSLENLSTQPLVQPGYPAGICLDELDIACDCYQPAPELLGTTAGSVLEETLYSHLLKSNCLVTGQPDWAMVVIRYRGRPIDRAGLLRYLVSFRGHNEFHEQCVERIYCDLSRHCAPEALLVYARYTRRGGLDINPCRSSGEFPFADNIREVRQ